MEFHCLSSSSSLKTQHKIPPSWAVSHKRNTRICSNLIKISSNCKWEIVQVQRRWLFTTKQSSKGSVETSSDDPIVELVAEKKGTIGGAVALIIGTSIGSGILALPNKALPAGIIPSSISMIICWGFLLIEAILLVELNVGLRRQKGKREDGKGIEILSIRTMAQDTLGDWGGNLATVTYVFLGYTSMVAYASKSGEILFHLLNLPESVSGCVFTLVFTLLISISGTETTDQVNQWLTASMIGLLLCIEVVCVLFGGWPGLMEGGGDWGKVPDTVPVMIFSLVYHDLAPVLCAYLGGDIARLRTSILIGSFVPLVGLLVWDAIAIGLSAQADHVGDPVELLVK
ncbi:Tyrosine-specific transport system 1 [Linum grandiflorum]